MSELYGKPLRYLIAQDDQIVGERDAVVEVGYEGPLPRQGVGVRYGNLFDQTGSGKYGPYARATDTASRYDEKKLNWKGKGWAKLIGDQLAAAQKAGFEYIELDNPDGYEQAAVMDACDRVTAAGMRLIAKNPQLLPDPVTYLRHASVCGVIVERDDDHAPEKFAHEMDGLRAAAGKPQLPVWFVTFGNGRAYAERLRVTGYNNMGVTYSHGEYNESIDMAHPTSPPVADMSAPVATATGDAAVLAAIAGHPAFNLSWKKRGQAPAGYIKGMALTFARVCRNLAAGDPAAVEMAKADSGNANVDALAHYSQQFAALDMPNNKDGIDTLRHLWVLMTGLGMRETSGQYNEGRDRSARNVSADTAEAGLFQQSWGTHGAHPEMVHVFTAYNTTDLDGYADVFKEGVHGGLSDDWGQGTGRAFQHLAKAKPAFACEFAALGLRHTRREWGPINRREAEISPTVNRMLLAVQKAIASPVSPTPVPVPVSPPAPTPIVKNLLDPERIAEVALAHGATWQKLNGYRHLFYIESINPDGTINDGRIDAWNDYCGIIEFSNEKPTILFSSRCTTEPGIYYDRAHVIGHGPLGAAAALIDTGYQEAWQVGIHHAGKPSAHEALVQTGGPVRVYRDYDRSFRRHSGWVHVGDFGINHHSVVGTADPRSVGAHSAGCLVISEMAKHRQRMSLIKGDARHAANPRRVIGSIVMPVAWLSAA